MTRPTRMASAAAWLAACLAMALMLPGCGAGMGGTGTGDSPPVELGDFGASAAPLCGSSLGVPLGCGSTAAPAANRSDWVDSATGGRVSLRIEANTAALRDDCAARRFDGTWGSTAAGEQRFFGSTLADGAVQRQAASLVVRLVVGLDGADTLQVQLFGLDGQALDAALTLRRARSDDPAPAACSG